MTHQTVYDRTRGHVCTPDCVACRQGDMFAAPRAQVTVTQVRTNRRERIEAFFTANLGERFPSSWCHAEFGSAFRTRVSEINRDTNAPITIHNETVLDGGAEKSRYWAEVR